MCSTLKDLCSKNYLERFFSPTVFAILLVQKRLDLGCQVSALYSLLHALYIVRGYPFTLLFTFWGGFLTQETIQLEVISSRGAKLVSFRIFSTT